jgi:hypothetical protein
VRVRHLLLAAVVSATAACGPSGTHEDPRTDGPLSLGETSTRLCVPIESTTATVGHRRLVHDGSSPVVITDVSLKSPQNLHLVEVVLVPPNEAREVHVGVHSRYPPESDLPPGWQERVEAVGSTVDPGDEWGFTVGLTTAGEESGRADAVVVEYTDDDGTVYQTLYNTEILLASGRCRGRR